MTRHAFPYPPLQPDGEWKVTLPGDMSIGELIVYNEVLAPSGPFDTIDFAYTGAYEAWTVPAGVTDIVMELWSSSAGSVSGSPQGSYLKCNAGVTPGEVLRVYVAGHGAQESAGGTGGWPDGGDSAHWANIGGAVRGNGAGASTSVRRSPYAEADIIACVGGPGATGVDGTTGSFGGLAGWPNGNNGVCSPDAARGGHGATPTTPGAGGVGVSNGNAGSGMQGGDGISYTAGDSHGGPGAGGGGLKGGGSGGSGSTALSYGGGGGAGSSGVPYATYLDFGVGVQLGDGKAAFAWEV